MPGILNTPALHAVAFDLELGSLQQEHPNKHVLRAGDRCPVCKVATLDYDGLLNLACPNCGYALQGCFT